MVGHFVTGFVDPLNSPTPGDNNDEIVLGGNAYSGISSSLSPSVGALEVKPR
jgi:hypothetical protein